MEIESQKQHLSTLEEMILDEQRLVTYTTISKELCIHANSCKSLLQDVVDKIKKKEPETGLNINYVVSGLCGDNKALTTVCSEKEIDAVKNKFTIVFYDHIYSVCKGSPKVDNIALMAVNKFEDFPLCVGIINNSICSKRSSDEIGNLKSHSLQTTTAQPQKASSFPGQPKPKAAIKVMGKQDSEVTKTANDQLKSAKSEPSIKTEMKSPTKDTKAKSDNKPKSQKGIAGFFGKQNGSSKNVIEKKEAIIKKPEAMIKEHVKEESMDVDDDCPPPLVPKPKQKQSTTNGHQKEDKKKVKQLAKNKSLTQIKTTAKVDKKRKRVLHISDSESDDDKDPFVDNTPTEDHESEDEIPPTPTTNTIKVTSAMVNPKKRRKIVDKTYIDDEGYVLTKKVEVYESYSEDEGELATKENLVVQNAVEVKKETSPKNMKKETKTSKKKISPPQKGKQATLMNFFKKA